MKLYKQAFLGAGLLGLSSLTGYGSESVKSEINLKLFVNGRYVVGEIDGIKIHYFHFDEKVWLRLENSSASKIEITDGDRNKDTIIDGNINYFNLSNKCFYYKDKGNVYYSKGFTTEETTEEAKKLREWGNKKLKKVYEICKEKFGDKLKIPYKIEKKDLDDILEDFNF